MTRSDRIKGLWAALVVYFFIFLNACWHAHEFPVWVFVAGSIVNAVMIGGFYVALRRAYRDKNNESRQYRMTNLDSVPRDLVITNKKIKGLWAGGIVYFFIFLNGIRIAARLPLWMFALASLVNASIIGYLYLALRRAYWERSQLNEQSGIPN